MKACVVTESAADIPKKLLDDHNIKIIPMSIIYPDNDSVFKEGVNITNEEYYDLLEKANKHPYTAQGNNAEMLELFQSLDNEGYDEIFYVTMSSKITSTYNSANLVRKIFKKKGGKANVTIFDSLQASFAIGIQAVKASILFKQGLSTEDVIAQLSDFRDRELKSTLTVASLKYLMKGGRISKVKYAIGSLLNVHPCLEGSSEGTLDVFSSARSYKQALEKIIDYAYDDIGSKTNLACYIIQGRSGDGISFTKQYLAKEYSSIKIYGVYNLSPVIYTHTGPGIVALILFEDFEH